MFKRYGVPVLEGVHCTTAEDALAAYDHLGSKVVAVKSQIHAGGRGKGNLYAPETGDLVMEGGVKIAFSREEVGTYAANILGNVLVTIQTGEEGKLVRNLYVESGCAIEHEDRTPWAMEVIEETGRGDRGLGNRRRHHTPTSEISLRKWPLDDQLRLMRLTQCSKAGSRPWVIATKRSFRAFITGRSLLSVVVSIWRIGVIFAAVPVRKTSSAIISSVLSTGRSTTGMSMVFASSITLALVIPSRMS